MQHNKILSRPSWLQIDVRLPKYEERFHDLVKKKKKKNWTKEYHDVVARAKIIGNLIVAINVT